jgi:hypothetical protein
VLMYIATPHGDKDIKKRRLVRSRTI